MKHFLLTIFFAAFATAAFAQAEQTMYWIGGAGNWSDLSHWSYRSGTQDPNDQPSSVPTANTHVIIDANSGLTGTSASANRTITLDISPVIKSLTFAAGSNARLYYSGLRILSVTGDVTLQKNTTIYNYFTPTYASPSGLCISMEPAAGTTSTLTTNDNPLTFYLGKKGQGTTNIAGDNISGINLNVLEGTLNFEGTGWSSTGVYVVNNGTVLNMPNITTCTLGTTYIGGTMTAHTSSYTATPYCDSRLNIPICTTMKGAAFTLSSTTAHSFPALQSLTLTGEMEPGNVNASLALGTGGTLVTCAGWGFTGTLLNADKSEFHITYTGTTVGTATTYAHYTAKDGTHIKKVVFENKNATAYLSSTGAYSQGITIDEVTFTAQGATIAQSMTIGTLSVAPSAAYSISAGKTITLTEDLVDNTPDCETFWQLTGQKNTLETINNSTGHDLALTNVQITDINAAGANAITAAGIDNGGNENIIFAAPAPKTLYWVGKGGDDQWHTLENWARTSGGTDYCMPTQYDNIVFDQNSVIIDTCVTITNQNAYFHDITIRDDCPKAVFSIMPSPTAATAPVIYCYGSWYMKPGVRVHPDVYFMSEDKSETITSNTSTFSDIYFTNTGGWTLADKLQTGYYAAYRTGDLYHRNGTLDTNGHIVDIAGSFDGNDSGATYLPAGSTAAAYRKLVLGSSEITIRGIGDSPCAWYFGSAATDTLDAGTSTIIFDPPTNSTANNTLTAYSSATGTGTTATSPNSPFNPSVATQNDALGTLRYHNIVFRGGDTRTRTNTITTTSGYTSSLTQFEANSVRAENKSTLSFTSNLKWVKLESLYAAPFSTVNLPGPAAASGILSTARLTIGESMEIPTPDCAGLSTLIPVNTSYPATIFSAADIHIPNTQMTNVKSTGGGEFTASGIDNGGNEGWIFTERSAKDLYWTGAAGDGMWNTPENWTTHPDGTPDGGCVPAGADNVHFNQYSVVPADKTIRIETNDAVFNNFIAEAGTPAGIIIHQNNVQVNSYGNLFQTGENMQFTANSTSYMVNLLGPATDARLINGAGSSFYRLVVNNAAARWVFTGNMTITNTLTITAVTELTLDMDKFTGYQITHSAGTLNADNTVWDISSQGFSSTGSGTRTVNIRNAQITTYTWNYSGTNATLNAEGSHVKVGLNFTGLNGQQYGTVETTYQPTSGMSSITGNLSFRKLILNNSRQISGSNTVDTLAPERFHALPGERYHADR